MEVVPLPSTVFLVMDLIGVFVFALSGGFAGRRAGLDFFGVTTVGALTGIGGGIMRDLLIGAIPPASLSDWRFIVVATVGGAIPAFVGRTKEWAFRTLLILDAFGLALFTVVSTSKALDYGIELIAAPLIGVVAAVGGGALRDVLTNEIPTILRREIYALAALAGGIVVVLGSLTQFKLEYFGVAALILTAGIRLASLQFHWKAPLQQDGETLA